MSQFVDRSDYCAAQRLIHIKTIMKKKLQVMLDFNNSSHGAKLRRWHCNFLCEGQLHSEGAKIIMHGAKEQLQIK
jgi:hypothetical protein